MATLTKQDKLSILQRLIKRVEKWRFNKSIPMLLVFGGNDLGPTSAVFQEWLSDVNKAIKIIFGEHSHYLADFNDIHYSEPLSVLLGNSKEKEANFWNGLGQATSMLKLMIEEVEAEKTEVPESASVGAAFSVPVADQKPCVFIGHGRSPLWARLKLYIQDELGLKVVCFESESRVGESVVPILKEMLNEANFAVLILTGEDETATGSKRARQNVIHEVGLFQSKLGFDKAVLLKQEGVEDFTNIAGLQHISFADNKIEHTFYELRKTLEREGLLS